MCDVSHRVGGVPSLLSQLDTTDALQAREGIAAADISMGLLHAQSQMGLFDRGPLSARALAEAALQVQCALLPSLCLPLSPSLCLADMPVEHRGVRTP